MLKTLIKEENYIQGRWLRLTYVVLPHDLHFPHYLPCDPLYFLPFGPDCSLAVKVP